MENVHQKSIYTGNWYIRAQSRTTRVVEVWERPGDVFTVFSRPVLVSLCTVASDSCSSRNPVWYFAVVVFHGSAYYVFQDAFLLIKVINSGDCIGVAWLHHNLFAVHL